MHVFAYGTLQDPTRAASVVGARGRVRAVGRGTVRGVLYDVGPYPALQPARSAHDIVPGVLLEVDEAALARLDEYEDLAGGLYVRTRCEVRMDDASVRPAWVYVYNRSTTGLPRIAAWPRQPDEQMAGGGPRMNGLGRAPSTSCMRRPARRAHGAG